MGEEGAAERLSRVTARIADACARRGRDLAEVHLLAVSKTQPPGRITDVASAGQTAFGENRVQEAAIKIPLCPGTLSWHLVGHLQSNKVKQAVRLFSMIHSIDSAERLCQINTACGEAGRNLPVCLQVNVSGEASKFGMDPDALVPTLREAGSLMHVDVCGLMTIPPVSEDPERARAFFRQLRELRDHARTETGFPLPELSMGMSADLEIAVEEGATWVRVGTDIFGARTQGGTP